jgi:hypothetical protein
MELANGTDIGEPAHAGEAVVRDDAGDLAGLMDLHRARRRAGGRLKLIDAGRLAVPDLERLAEAGVEIHSSESARSDPHELVLIALAGRKGGAAAAFLVEGPFHAADEGGDLSFGDILDLGRTGMRIAVSDGRVARDPEDLDRLADACRKGGTRLIFYHAGSPAIPLAELCRTGAWVHVDAAAFGSDAVAVASEWARAAAAAGGGLILHVSGPIAPDALADLFHAGAYILFRTRPFDYRDPRRAIEARSARRPAPAEASYLFSGFML